MGGRCGKGRIMVGGYKSRRYNDTDNIDERTQRTYTYDIFIEYILGLGPSSLQMIRSDQGPRTKMYPVGMSQVYALVSSHPHRWVCSVLVYKYSLTRSCKG